MILFDLEALSAKSAADVAKAVIDPNWKRIDIIPCDKAIMDFSILSKRFSVGSFALLGIGLSKIDDTMIEFDSLEVARRFYFSDDYQAAKAVRDACSQADLMLIEGAE